MARLESGSYDEIVVHLEKELELKALEETDVLPIATMTSSTSKPKNLLPNGHSPTSNAIIAKKNVKWSKTLTILKVKEMSRRANQPKRKYTPSVGLVATGNILRNDVGKVLVHI